MLLSVTQKVSTVCAVLTYLRARYCHVVHRIPCVGLTAQDHGPPADTHRAAGTPGAKVQGLEVSRVLIRLASYPTETGVIACCHTG